MGGLLSGRSGAGGWASPLNSKIDPLGNKYSDTLFGKMKQQQQVAASKAEDVHSAADAGEGIALEEERKRADKKQASQTLLG